MNQGWGGRGEAPWLTPEEHHDQDEGCRHSQQDNRWEHLKHWAS